MKIPIVFFLVFAGIFFYSCEQSPEPKPKPEAPANVWVEVTDTQYLHLPRCCVPPRTIWNYVDDSTEILKLMEDEALNDTIYRINYLIKDSSEFESQIFSSSYCAIQRFNFPNIDFVTKSILGQFVFATNDGSFPIIRKILKTRF